MVAEMGELEDGVSMVQNGRERSNCNENFVFGKCGYFQCTWPIIACIVVLLFAFAMSNNLC